MAELDGDVIEQHEINKALSSEQDYWEHSDLAHSLFVGDTFYIAGTLHNPYTSSSIESVTLIKNHSEFELPCRSRGIGYTWHMNANVTPVGFNMANDTFNMLALTDIDLSPSSTNLLDSLLCFEGCNIIADIYSPVDTVCAGVSVDLQYAGANAMSFEWRVGLDGEVFATTESAQILFDMPGTYEVYLEASNTNCQKTVSKQIVVQEKPEAILDYNMISCAQLNEGQISVTAMGGIPPYDYQWSTFDTSEMVQGLDPGFYAITVTDAQQCMDEVSVQLGQLSLIQQNDTVICPSRPVTLIVNAPLTPDSLLVWNNGMTGDTIVVQPDTTTVYTVTFTDAQGICTDECVITVVSGFWFYADTDNDGFGDANNDTLSCDQPLGYVADDRDCDDSDSLVNLVYWYFDWDGDGFGDVASSVLSCEQPSGYVAFPTDCDDTDSTIYPGAPEVTCDGIDQDCDGWDQSGDLIITHNLIDYHGEIATVHYSVTNIGTSPVSLEGVSWAMDDNVTLNITGSSDDSTGNVDDILLSTYILTTDTAFLLMPDSSLIGSLSLAIDTSVFPFLLLTIDASDSIPECDETNNSHFLSSYVLPACPVLISPENGLTHVDPGKPLTWLPSPHGADGYQISISSQEGSVLGWTDVGDTTSYIPDFLPSDEWLYVSFRPYSSAGTTTGCRTDSFLTRSNVDCEGLFEQELIADADNAAGVHTVDLDGDGDLDVLGAFGNVTWFENLGTGAFVPHTIDSNVGTCYRVYGVDFDKDGDTDVFSSQYSNDELVLYQNDGLQIFSKHIIDANFDGGYNVHAADVDSDGDIDLVGASNQNGDIYWYEYIGGTSFTKHVIDPSFSAVRCVYAADVDGDGDIDVAGAALGADQIAWWENDGNEGFTKHIVQSGYNGAHSVIVADMDQDGDMDLVGCALSADKVDWWENDGAQNFSLQSISTSFNGAVHVDVADIDNDGDMDVAAAAWNGDQVAWWEQDSTGVFVKHVLSSVFDAPYDIEIADLDGDGDPDLLSAARHDDQFAWWNNLCGPVPDCIDLIQPLSGASDVDPTEQITWSKATGNPAGYRISVGITSGGGEIMDAVDIGLSNTIVLDSLLYGTQLFVKIVPYNGGGEATGCSEFSFTTGTQDKPYCTTLIYPESSSVYFDTVGLSWSEGDGDPLGYRLTLETSPGASDILGRFGCRPRHFAQSGITSI